MLPSEIKELLDRRDWTPKQLAEAVFVDATTVARWLCGVTSPKPSLQRRLRELLDSARKRDKEGKKAIR